ncbi:uncharacterized protein LOC144201189 [Stigmatopora nigra]
MEVGLPGRRRSVSRSLPSSSLGKKDLKGLVFTGRCSSTSRRHPQSGTMSDGRLSGEAEARGRRTLLDFPWRRSSDTRSRRILDPVVLQPPLRHKATDGRREKINMDTDGHGGQGPGQDLA